MQAASFGSAASLCRTLVNAPHTGQSQDDKSTQICPETKLGPLAATERVKAKLLQARPWWGSSVGTEITWEEGRGQVHQGIPA